MLKSTREMKEEKVNELEDRSSEMIQTEQRHNKCAETHRSLKQCQNVLYTYNWSPRGEERKNTTEKYLNK